MTHQAARRALVIGGGGTLNPCAEWLAAHGWHVVLPCRRYHPLTNCPETGSDFGKALWVEASWSEPEQLVDKAATALEHPAELVVAWLPEQYRSAMLRTVARLLTDDAGIVEVYSGEALRHGLPEPALPERVTQRVALGYVPARAGANLARRISHAEAIRAINDAIARAARGAPPRADQIGEPAAWASAQP